ncbi:MAG TPA: hypothetical protein VN957_28795 [Chthoniobacterales bacterium]|nr:hypothetical protein [Chthoniobacterales bacterium]
MLHLPKHRTGVNLINRVSTKEERSNNTEVSAATSYGPEKIRIFSGTRGHEAAIGQHQISF